MRRGILGLLFVLCPLAPAQAILDGTADKFDRFPFVVEVKFDGQLICSGTVLFPRIVVTAAHCVQQKVQWRGGQFYVDDYLPASGLSVTVTSSGKTETHEAAEIAASPVWRTLSVTDGDRAGERFAYDIALIITRDAIEVGPPPSLDKLADAALYEADMTTTGRREDVLPGALSGNLTRRGILVAFGAIKCIPFIGCDDAGTRRYRQVSIKESADCFNDPRGKPRWPPLPAEFVATLPLAVWCMESSVMPGDSGGALLVEGEHGAFYYLGVISAQQGLSAEFATAASEKRSLAAALYPNFDFIAEAARRLGYTP